MKGRVQCFEKIVFRDRKDDLASMDSLPLEEALAALGELLAADGESIRLVVVGGAALRLQGLVERTTMDVDVIARMPVGEGPQHPEPLPSAVMRAADAVARDLGLPADWLNTEIAAQ